MMKYSIEIDERYPVITLRKPTTKRGIHQPPSDMLKRFLEAEKAYDRTQREMIQWYCEQNGHEDGYFGACWCAEVAL